MNSILSRWILLAAAALSGGAVTDSEGCTLPADWTLAKEVDAAKLIFLGDVTRITTGVEDGTPYTVYEIAVDRVLKGQLPSDPYRARLLGGTYVKDGVEHGLHSCNPRLRLQERYLVFIDRESEGPGVVLFSGRSPYWLRRNPVKGGTLLMADGGPFIVGIEGDNWIFDATEVERDPAHDHEFTLETYAKLPRVALTELMDSLGALIEQRSRSQSAE